MATDVTERPAPDVDEENAGYWDSLRRHELALQRCADCGRFWSPAGSFCRWCLSDRWSWERVSGRGTLYAFTVVHQVYHPAFREAAPYPAAVVELEEGPRLLATVDCAPRELRVGMALEVGYRDLPEGFTLLAFRPVTGGTR